MVKKEKKEALSRRMEGLEIQEEDLIEKFILGSGKGGQKINKSSSCVYLKHLPSEIEVKCQKSRSQELNRYLAREELCDKIEEKLFAASSRKRAEIEKIRRQKQKRSKRAKERVLREKKQRSNIKDLRKNIPSS